MRPLSFTSESQRVFLSCLVVLSITGQDFCKSGIFFMKRSERGGARKNQAESWDGYTNYFSLSLTLQYSEYLTSEHSSRWLLSTL